MGREVLEWTWTGVLVVVVVMVVSIHLSTPRAGRVQVPYRAYFPCWIEVAAVKILDVTILCRPILYPARRFARRSSAGVESYRSYFPCWSEVAAVMILVVTIVCPAILYPAPRFAPRLACRACWFC